MNKSSPLYQLLNTLPQIGRVEWIGIRPARNEPMISLSEVEINLGKGLEGDRFNGRANSPRQVTLIQQAHLSAIGTFLHQEAIDPALLRRNIVISGINLLALKDKTFRVGSALLEYTGLCHPCSKMERQLGPGGYNAMRGHGGITARVLEAGAIRLTDNLAYIPAQDSDTPDI